MAVLVTGATGFIGRKLVSRLVKDGMKVHALVRSPERAGSTLPPEVKCFKWASTGEPVPPAALQGVTGVINLAGEGVADKRWSQKRKRAIVDSRVKGTQALVQAIARMPHPVKIVSASAVGYYGETGSREVDEGAPNGGDFLASVCREWEGALRGLNPSSVAIIRISMVLGKEGGALPKMLLPFRKGLGGALGSPERYISWIHVDDLVSLLRWALTSDRVSGVFNASSPTPVTNGVFTQALAKALGKPAILPVPGFLLRLALGEMASVVLTSCRAIPRRTENAGYQFKFPVLQDALTDLLSNA